MHAIRAILPPVSRSRCPSLALITVRDRQTQAMMIFPMMLTRSRGDGSTAVSHHAVMAGSSIITPLAL